eukprot:7029865-Alexandrium_andersonii.AAC.1
MSIGAPCTSSTSGGEAPPQQAVRQQEVPRGTQLFRSGLERAAFCRPRACWAFNRSFALCQDVLRIGQPGSQ